jgi:acyl carrier protein
MLSDDAAVKMAIQLVAHALCVKVDSIDLGMKIHDIPPWDSLGQLRIALTLEEALHLEITDPRIFSSLSSISGIADYLVSYSSRNKDSSLTAFSSSPT